MQDIVPHSGWSPVRRGRPHRAPGVRFQRRLVKTRLASGHPPHVGGARAKVRRRVPVPAKQPVVPIGGERDVPYEFAAQSLSVPTRRWRPAKLHWRVALSRRLVFNAMVLLLGFAVVLGGVGNLRGVGRGMLAVSDLRAQAGQAYGRVLAATDALARSDFEASEASFRDARTTLKVASAELDEALASTKHVLLYLDPTNTARSGVSLLEAGEKLAEAGEHISRGTSGLLGEGDMSLVDTLLASRKEFGVAVELLGEVEGLLEQVDSPFLPDEISDPVADMGVRVPKVREALELFVEQSEVLLTVVGLERERQYLMLFENNHELRPTGGFIGSVGLVAIDRGVVEEIDVRTVYDGDGQLKEYILPPEPLLKITNRWYLRDANWFIDFPTSARKIAGFLEKEGGPTVDGIVALTPDVVAGLLVVTGPIEVPEYGLTIDADNFRLETQDQVSYSYDTELNQPKKFLADLTPLLLDRLFSLPTERSLEVVNVMATMLQEKQMMLYFKDEELQQRLVAAGWAGLLPRDHPGLLAVNNANIAGHKSDQFIEQEIDHRFEVSSEGVVEGVTTIRRTHRGPEDQSGYQYPEDENPAYKDNVVYQRMLVPEGAELIDAKGFTPDSLVPRLVVPEETVFGMEADADVVLWQSSQETHKTGTKIGKEAGYTFFANWMVTKPGGTTVALYRYRLPGKVSMPGLFDPVGALELLVVKQPGDLKTDVRVSVSLPEGVSIVHTSPREGITRGSDGDLVYRGEMRWDTLVGIVFERK